MDKKSHIKHSRFISLVLRHRPQEAGLELDEAGWVDVALLLEGMRGRGRELSREELEDIVASNDKQRFAFSEDGLRIRASQGHSVDVELGYEPATPPAELLHGTVAKFLDSIREHGLLKGSRHHVHLSANRETAEKVGQRRGRPVVLVVDAAAMHTAGRQFYVTANGVWLTEHAPPEFIRFPDR